MKLTVKCSVAGGDSSTKELVIHNPAATLSNLRAAIAINFRLPVYSFRMVHGTADLSCEKTPLRDSGIRDGDMIVVSAKREREEDENDESDVVRNNKEKEENKNNKGYRGDDGAGESQKDEQTAEGKETGAKAPAPLTTTTATAMPSPTPAVSGGGDVFARADSSGHDNEDDNNSNNNNEDEDDDDFDVDDDGMDDDDGPTELLSHLLATVPNLVEMRRQFLASPAEVMQQIRDRDPRLLELITANHQEFLDIVSNESLVQTLQEEQEAFADEEAEFDEEAEEAMTAVLAQMMGGGEAAEEAAETETENYLRRATTEEEEAKIEQLTQLGFNRDQCKVAFFKAKRSLERAANLLFEDPPQL